MCSTGSEDVVDDVVGLDVLGLAFEVEDQAVPQGRVGHGAEVFAGDVVAVVEDGADLGGQDDRLGAARARAVADVTAGSSRWPASFSGCVASTSAMP